MRDDVLIQAIDNTEDVLLHGGRWSEEAKERVRQARRAGRRVSEMFGNLYRNGRMYANKVDSKYNISEHNVVTDVMRNQERRAVNTPQASWKKLSATKAGKRADASVQARLRQALKRQSKTKNADQQFKDNVATYNKAVAKYNKTRKRPARKNGKAIYPRAVAE